MGRFLVTLPKERLALVARTRAVEQALATSGYSPLEDPELAPVVDALAAGRRFAAGKAYREVTGCGPIQAGRAIDALIALRQESR